MVGGQRDQFRRVATDVSGIADARMEDLAIVSINRGCSVHPAGSRPAGDRDGDGSS
jgi:hypothetical protein